MQRVSTVLWRLPCKKVALQGLAATAAARKAAAATVHAVHHPVSNSLSVCITCIQSDILREDLVKFVRASATRSQSDLKCAQVVCCQNQTINERLQEVLGAALNNLATQ
jgi:hypothetical protein